MTASDVRGTGAGPRTRVGAGSAHRPRPPVLWVLRMAGRRVRVQWRLLAVVAVVALLVSTLVAALTLLVATTEDAASTGRSPTHPRRAPR